MSWFFALILACSGPQTAPSPDREAPAEPRVEPAPEPEPEPLPDPTEEKLAATHVLIAWTGSAAGAAVDRTRDEARALAEALRKRATRSTIGDLARTDSDDPTGRRGGHLGVWRTGRMSLAFERCVSATQVGQIGAVCESEYGFHVIRRDPVIEVAGRHWSVAYAGLDARAGAQAALLSARTALVDGADPSELSPAATELGLVAPGQLIPAVEMALYGTSPGGFSEVFEAAGAFHLVQRL